MQEKYGIEFINDCKRNTIKDFVSKNYEKIKNLIVEEKEELSF
jgi:hypothetical protein